MVQLDLSEFAPPLPEGFKYRRNALSPQDEQTLIDQIHRLPFQHFKFQGYTANRRVVSFGWRYDFNHKAVQKAEEIPPFLLPLRELAGAFSGLPAKDLQQASVIEYCPGAAIGWHRDKAVFGDVIGVSLLSPCRFRFRRPSGSKWERASLAVEPRSVYLLRGPSRAEWEHSIPSMDALRYSITFRNIR